MDYKNISDNYHVTCEELRLNLKFRDTLLTDWARQFHVVIPPANKLSKEQIIILLIDVENLIQKASNFYTLASMVHLIKTNELEEIRSSQLVKLNAAAMGTKRVNKDVMTAAVVSEDSVMDSVQAELAARIMKEFWRDTLDRLKRCSDILNNIQIAKATISKYGEDL